MATKKNLQECLDDWSKHSCIQINLIWSDGRKAGIANPKAIEAAMNALRNELKRQINELTE